MCLRLQVKRKDTWVIWWTPKTASLLPQLLSLWRRPALSGSHQKKLFLFYFNLKTKADQFSETLWVLLAWAMDNVQIFLRLTYDRLTADFTREYLIWIKQYSVIAGNNRKESKTSGAGFNDWLEPKRESSDEADTFSPNVSTTVPYLANKTSGRTRENLLRFVEHSEKLYTGRSLSLLAR